MSTAVKELEQAKRELARYAPPEKRALISTGTTAGGYTVSDSEMKSLVIGLRGGSPVRRWSRILTTQTGGVQPIPSYDESAIVAAIVAENTPQASQDCVFGQTAIPVYGYRTSLVLSTELWQDIAERDGLFRILGHRIGRAQNAALTVGTGSAQPRGVCFAATNSTLTTAAVPTLADYLDLRATLDVGYRDELGTRFAIMTSPETWLASTKLSATDPRWAALYRPRSTPDGLDMLDGTPIVLNQDMPTGTGARGVVCGDFSKFAVRDVESPVQVIVSRERYAEQHSVLVKGVSRTGGDLLVANSLKYSLLG